MADDVIFPPRNTLDDNMVAARVAGYSWPDIHSFVADRMAASRSPGADYHDDEINQYLGRGSPNDLNDRLRGALRQNIARGKIDG